MAYLRSVSFNVVRWGRGFFWITALDIFEDIIQIGIWKYCQNFIKNFLQNIFRNAYEVEPNRYGHSFSTNNCNAFTKKIENGRQFNLFNNKTHARNVIFLCSLFHPVSSSKSASDEISDEIHSTDILFIVVQMPSFFVQTAFLFFSFIFSRHPFVPTCVHSYAPFP